MNPRAAIAIAEGPHANAGREPARWSARLGHGGATRGADENGGWGFTEGWR
jgi:hypothetical protein